MRVLLLEDSFHGVGVVQPGDHLTLAAVTIATVPEDAIRLVAAVLGIDEAVAVDVVAARSVADDSNFLAGSLQVHFQVDSC